MWLYYESYILSETNIFLLAFFFLFSLEPQLPSSRQKSPPYEDRGDERELASKSLRVESTFSNRNVPKYYGSSVCTMRKGLYLRGDVRPVDVGLKIAIIEKRDRGEVMYEYRMV